MLLLSEVSDMPEYRQPKRLFSSIESAVLYLKEFHSVVNSAKVELDLQISSCATDYDTFATQVIIKEKYPFFMEYTYMIENIPMDRSCFAQFLEGIKK